MSDAFMLYFNGKGPAPGPQELAEARRRRAVADDLFALAVRNWNASKRDAPPPGPGDS